VGYIVRPCLKINLVYALHTGDTGFRKKETEGREGEREEEKEGGRNSSLLKMQEDSRNF
jgi:hypothetical protein